MAERLVGGAAENRPHAHRRADQGAGLHRLHLGNGGLGQKARLPFDVAHLAADHAAGPSPGRQLGHQPHEHSRIAVGLPGKQLKSERQ